MHELKNALHVCVHSSTIVASIPDITSFSFHTFMGITVNKSIVMYKYICYVSVTEYYNMHVQFF
jgi:hypothetical protein